MRAVTSATRAFDATLHCLGERQEIEKGRLGGGGVLLVKGRGGGGGGRQGFLGHGNELAWRDPRSRSLRARRLEKTERLVLK